MAEEQKHLLVVDDDNRLRSLLQRYLREQGFLVTAAEDAFRAKEFLSLYSFDMLIVDIMMPKISGTEFLKELRAAQNNIPVILLTAMGEAADRVNGLEIGADDYVTKPFNPLELVARVKSQIRRYTQLGNLGAAGESGDKLLTNGGLVINDSAKSVTVDGEEVKLTPIEYNILYFLTKNSGRVFTADQIYEAVWDEDAIASDNVIAVHVRHIREKIEINPKDPRYLKVVWGQGYKMEKKMQV